MADANDKLTAAELNQFTGSEHCYRHELARNILFTDGAMQLGHGPSSP